MLAIQTRTGVAFACVVLMALTVAGVLLYYMRPHAQANRYALDVAVIGHQYWWEIRYPQLEIVTANEIHIPAGSAAHPDPTRLTVSSADVEHGFAVQALGLKADSSGDDASTAWVTPETTGMYVGKCLRNCGTQSDGMRVRVYVDSPAEFRAWATHQKEAAVSDPDAMAGKTIFEHTACISCHTIAGTIASGRFGPDLTHVADRATIAGGLLPNTKENLYAFIDNPAQVKPGCLMPAMHLKPHDLDAVTAYIASLK